MSNGAQILRQQERSKSTAGVMVLRVRLELPEAEQTVGVYSGDLHIWKGGGYGGHDLTGDGEFILLGNAYQNGAHAGTIEIQTLRHACPALVIEVPEGKVVAGELLVQGLAQGPAGFAPRGRCCLDRE